MIEHDAALQIWKGSFWNDGSVFGLDCRVKVKRFRIGYTSDIHLGFYPTRQSPEPRWHPEAEVLHLLLESRNTECKISFDNSR